MNNLGRSLSTGARIPATQWLLGEAWRFFRKAPTLPNEPELSVACEPTFRRRSSPDRWANVIRDQQQTLDTRYSDLQDRVLAMYEREAEAVRRAEHADERERQVDERIG